MSDDFTFDGEPASGLNGHDPMAEVDFNCSIIQQADDTDARPISFRQAMEGIRSGRWARGVSAVRLAYARGLTAPATPKVVRGKMETEEQARTRTIKEQTDAPKKALPGLLFSGTFRYRAEDELIEHSGLICADLDHLGDQVGAIKERIASDPHCIAAFISPTATGVKAVFRCDPTKPHADAFEALDNYIHQQFGLIIDVKCADVSRICFVSHDPEAFVADNAELLPAIDPAKKPKPKEFKPKPVHVPGQPVSTIDDYNMRGAQEVPELLEKHGWKKAHRNYWTRPGKERGVSASWGYYENTLIVYSESPETGLPSDQDGFDPFDIFTHLEHGGDKKAAAKALYHRGYGTRLESAKTKSRQEQNLDRIAGPAPEPASTPSVTAVALARPITSFAYPSDDDPNMLLGSDDYLGRGGGLLFVSHAGAGKSSWAMDACMMWALGKAWMQIKSHQPRKVLIIQAEDSDRYIGKIFASFAHVNKLTADELELLGKNCVIVRLKGVSGPVFFTELARLTELHQPDLVVINPIYLYAEGDITRSEFAQPFLIGLDAVNKAERWAYILIHHTGKPQAKGNNGKRAEVEDWESAYMGFGSSYLANWPRATILLEPVSGNPGHFQIKLGKGGYNAGVTRKIPQGVGFRDEPHTRISVKHSKDKMQVNGRERPVFYWEIDTDAPEPESASNRGGRKAGQTIAKFAAKIPQSLEKAQTIGQIHRAVGDLTELTYNGFKKAILRAYEDGQIRMVERSGLGPCFYLPPPPDPTDCSRSDD